MSERLTLARALVVLLLAAAGALCFNALMPQGIAWLPPEITRPDWRPVDLARAKELYRQGALFVDARDPGDYKLAHLRRAVNLYPEEWGVMFPLLKSTVMAAPTVVVYGKGRSRFPAAWVGQRLRQAGHPRVLVLAAGVEALESAGLPIRKRRR